MFVILLAGLTSFRQHIYEAVELDGVDWLAGFCARSRCRISRR